MIDVLALQRAYVELYKALREYIWNFDTVCRIADLEVATYESCPNLEEIRNHLRTLRTSTFDVCREDEDLSKAFDDFEELVNSGTETFFKLYKVDEVVQI